MVREVPAGTVLGPIRDELPLFVGWSSGERNSAVDGASGELVGGQIGDPIVIAPTLLVAGKSTLRGEALLVAGLGGGRQGVERGGVRSVAPLALLNR
jgi:hypothetical protein